MMVVEKVATDAPNGQIDVDRCPYCGGIWLDHFEINRLPTHEALRLAGMPTLLNFSSFVKPPYSSFHCPHCGVTLMPLKGMSLPNKSHVFTCPHCRGHFVSKKELVRIKENQDSHLKFWKNLAAPLPSIYTILIPLMLLGLVGAASLFSVTRLKDKQEAQTRARELLSIPIVIPLPPTKPTREVIVSFTTVEPMQAQITIKGPQRVQPLTLTINANLKTLHTIQLVDLSPQTTYIYTITVSDASGIKTESEPFMFTTP